MTKPLIPDTVLYINRADRPDRKAFVMQQILALGKKPERLDAPVLKDRGGFQHTGGRGCYESHVEAIRMSAARLLIVFEDDAKVTDLAAFHHAIEAVQLIPNWDMLYLYGGGTCEPARVRNVLNMHAYMVNPASALKLYVTLSEFHQTVMREKWHDWRCCLDRYMIAEVQPKMNIYGVQECVVQHREAFGSDTGWALTQEERERVASKQQP